MQQEVQSLYPSDYSQAQFDFEKEITGRPDKHDWTLQLGPALGQAPGGQPLRTQTAIYDPPTGSSSVLVLSTGLHGVEGFLGTAIVLGLLRRWRSAAPNCRVVIIHSLNPYGFAYLRRFDEHNVDLNRNFVVDDTYVGCPPLYPLLDNFLNPELPPAAVEWNFELHAVRRIVQHGFAKVQHAVASGQYDYPKGLFYGGAQAAVAKTWLAEGLPSWLDGAERIVHLDFHTGLGRWGKYQLFVESPFSTEIQNSLKSRFPPQGIKDCSQQGADASAEIYSASGSFGKWCSSKYQELSGLKSHLFTVVEFGTYSPIQVLKALKRENQWYHWGHLDTESKKASEQQVKRRLLEAFCPKSERWRLRCYHRAVGVVEGMIELLKEGSA